MSKKTIDGLAGTRITNISDLSKTAEDGDGNVGKTIKLITEDKKRT